MAGPVNMSVDHLTGNNGVAALNVQEAFVVIYNFLNSQFTRIASYNGEPSGPLDGLGFDFFDAGSGHAGEKAWAIFRTNGNAVPAFNIVLSFSNVQWLDWVLESIPNFNNGVGMGAAILDTGLDAWNGTTVDTGTDTVGSPVWDIGAANEMFTFDYFNEEPGSAEFAEKNDLLRVSGNPGTTGKALFHMWADDDGFMIIYDGTNDINGNIHPVYFGAYDPIVGNTQKDGIPVIAAHGGNSSFWQTGGVTGTYGIGNNQEGGGILPLRGKAASSIPGFVFEAFLDSTENVAHQPNRQLDTAAFPMPRVGLVNTSGALTGHCGFLPDWVRYAYNAPFNARNNTTPDRAIFGSPGANIRGLLPWHTGAPPGANASRAGIQATWNGP